MDELGNSENTSNDHSDTQQSNGLQLTPAPTSQEDYVSQVHEQSRKLLLLILVAPLVIIGGSAAVYHYWHTNKSKPTLGTNTHTTQATTTNTFKATDVQTPFLTYVSQNKPKSLLVINSQQKTLSTLSLPSNKNTFTVLANNGQAVLAEESYIRGGSDAHSIYYWVKGNGQSSELTSSATTILHSITIDGFLSGDSNYVYVSCFSKSCTVNVMNLATATVATVYSTPFTPPPPTFLDAPSSSMNLIGVSPANIAYAVVYPADGRGAGTLTEINLSTNARVKSLPMTYPCLNPELANNFQTLIYTNGTDDKTAELMDLSTGKTTAVRSGIAGVIGVTYVWSPDSTKVAIVENPVTYAQNQNAISTPITLAYVDVSTAQVETLKNFGDSRFNNVNVDGWVSATQLNYDYTQSATANYFTGNPNLFAIDTDSDVVTPNPTPAGYKIVTPSSD